MYQRHIRACIRGVSGVYQGCIRGISEHVSEVYQGCIRGVSEVYQSMYQKCIREACISWCIVIREKSIRRRPPLLSYSLITTKMNKACVYACVCVCVCVCVCLCDIPAFQMRCV